MKKALERALVTCKSGDLRGHFPVSFDQPKPSVSRVALWIGFSALLLLLAFLIDGPVDRLLRLGSENFTSHFAGYASKAGEGWVVAVLGAAGSLFLFWRRRFDASRGVFLVAMTGLLTGAAATIIRSLLGRTRPSSRELQGFYGVWHDSHWIIGRYEFGAFPSGHAATVIGLAAAAWLIDRRLGMLTAIYAIIVSWSRIAMGCHHFSDAVAAAILGIYGAHLILARLGPSVYGLGESLESAWLARKQPEASSRTQKHV